MISDKTLLDQKPLVDSFLQQGPRPLSAFSFAAIFAWGDFFDFEFKIINGNLCIFAQGIAGCFLYLPPLGKSFDAATLEEVFRHMARAAGPAAAHRIENIPGNLLSVFGPGRYNQYIKPAEYVYHKEDLVALKGNAYKSQRHDCNCFASRQAAHSFAPYTDADFAACMDLYERWAGQRAAKTKDPVYLSMLDENRRVHDRMLKFYEPLGLVARVLRVDGKIVGYTFGFAIDEKTFCVYAEIADAGVAGAAAYLFRSFCSDEVLKGFEHINTMDDFAMPNVARAKEAYHPAQRVASYSVSLKA